jgi:xanthine dehydrogenase accessory factor
MVSVASILPRTAAPHEVLRVALGAIEAGRRVVVATVVARRGSAPSTPGQKLALVEAAAGFEAVGTVGGGAVERVVLTTMLEVLGDPASQPKLDTFRLGASLGMCCGGAVDVLVEPMTPAVHVLLVGGGHVGAALAPLLASLGFRVVLVDARPEAADPARVTPFGSPLPSAGSLRVLCADHDDPEVSAALPRDLGSAAMIVMTHDHKLDQAVIEWAIQKGFGFVGGVGSRAKAARTRARLEAKGASTEDVARVRMPVGVDVGARTPAEIAVAIAAELVAHRAERLGTRRHARHEARASDEADAPDEAPEPTPSGPSAPEFVAT